MNAQRMFTGWHRIGLASLLGGAVLLSGCASDGEVHGSVYMGVGVGYYDPWYWGGCCDNDVDIDIDIDNDIDIGPRPEQPIAKPPSDRPVAKPVPAGPSARPSGPSARPAPAAPRPAATPRGGGGGRRR